MADLTMPDFSVPDLAAGDLTRPGLVLPDPTLPDPYLPDLTRPDLPEDLDMLSTAGPDPAPPDLTRSSVPGDLRMPDTSVPEYAETLKGEADIALSAKPGDLADSALEFAHASPDARNLPADLSYRQDYTTQEAMTHRLRHLATLLLGLDGKVEVRDEPHPY